MLPYTDIIYKVSMKNPSPLPRAAQSSEGRHAISRLRQLLIAPELLQASLFQRRRPCGKSYCRCATSKRHHHASWYVSFSRKGRLQTKCIPQAWVEPVRQWIERYRETEALLQIISKSQWEHLKRARR